MSGLKAATAFTCPDGYEGASCQPLCTAEECEPLTYAQFNALDLYGNTFARPSADLTDSGRPDVLGVRTTGLSRPQADPATAQCLEYDVCQDRVNGFKHDVDGALLKGEFYLCANKSERRACRDQTRCSARRNMRAESGPSASTEVRSSCQATTTITTCSVVPIPRTRSTVSTD